MLERPYKPYTEQDKAGNKRQPPYTFYFRTVYMSVLFENTVNSLQRYRDMEFLSRQRYREERFSVAFHCNGKETQPNFLLSK